MLTPIAIEQEYNARTVLHAFVAHLFLYAASKEALAAFTRGYTVVIATCSVTAYLAEAH